MALESGKLCVKVMHCCIQCTRTCVYLYLNVSFSHIHVLFHPPFPFSFSLSLSLSLHMHTHTHTQHKYLDRCTHTSIVHDELNDILNLLLVLVSFTLLPWTLATTPWMVNCEGQGWVLLQRCLDSIH